MRRSAADHLFLNTSVRPVEKGTASVEAPPCSSRPKKQLRFAGTIFIDATGQGTPARSRGRLHYGARQKAFGESFAQDREDQQAMAARFLPRARLGREAPFRSRRGLSYSETKMQARRHSNPNGGYGDRDGSSFHHHRQRGDVTNYSDTARVWDHLKNHCRIVDRERVRNYALDLVTPVTYKREGRRLRGDHVITQNDLQRRELFADRVAFGGWFIDLHEAKGLLDEVPEALAADPEKIDELGVRPYPIPLGALYSRNVENLMMAGRTISTTHVAFGATRVQQTCAVFGQAAGTAAALCVKRRVGPRVLRKPHGRCQQTLGARL